MGEGDSRNKVDRKQVRRLGPVAPAVRSGPPGGLLSPRVHGPVRSSDEAALTIGAWLRLNDADTEEAGTILLAAFRNMGARVRLPASDREDVEAEAVFRALAEDHAALRRARPSTPLGAWARGCVRKVSLEVFRSRRGEKEKETSRGGEVVAPGPSPYQVTADRDELRFERAKVLDAALIFPRPYGHVLVWRLIDGLSWLQIRARLNAHLPPGTPPIGSRWTMKLIEDATVMLREFCAGVAPRAAYGHRFLTTKNPWMCAPLPPLATQ